MNLPQHPERLELAEELHSRPSTELQSPCAVSHLALMTPPGSDGLRTATADLCRRYGASPPHHDRHHAATLGALRVRWEMHTEFVSYSFFQERPSTDARDTGFDRRPIELLPRDWLAGLEVDVIAATHVVVEPAEGGITVADFQRLLEGQRVLGCEVLGGSAEVFTAFRNAGDGFTRFYVRDRGMSPGRIGRLVQRLIEIDTYRMMALLGLPVAKSASPQLGALERRLAALVARLGATADLAEDQGLLDELFGQAQEVERLVAQSAFRYSATSAYGRLVHDRLSELHERHMPDLQPLGQFLERRFEPALRTCASVAERQESLSRRIARTADLARTRVDVALQKQNRALLASMERRAGLQLRLQETVEGLSVFAISYYALGILGYLLGGPLKQGPYDVVLSIVAPVLLAVVWFVLRRWRRRLAAEQHD